MYIVVQLSPIDIYKLVHQRQELPGHYALDWNPGRNVLWPQYEMTSTANWPSAQGLSLLLWPSALCRTGPTIKLYKQTRSACLLHWVSRAGPWAKLEFQGAFLTDSFIHPSLLGWPTRDQVITERQNIHQQDLIRYSSPCHKYMGQHDDCWFIHLRQGLDIWSDPAEGLIRYSSQRYMNQQCRDDHVSNNHLFDMLLQKEVLLMFESQKF